MYAETRQAIEQYIRTQPSPVSEWLRECLLEIDRLDSLSTETLDSDLDRLAEWSKKFKEMSQSNALLRAEIELLRGSG